MIFMILNVILKLKPKPELNRRENFLIFSIVVKYFKEKNKNCSSRNGRRSLLVDVNIQNKQEFFEMSQLNRNCCACDELQGHIRMESSVLVTKMFNEVTGLDGNRLCLQKTFLCCHFNLIYFSRLSFQSIQKAAYANPVNNN